MLISLNWLRDFVKIPKTISYEKLGELLTTHTVEIDSVTKQADIFAGFVVGKILEIKKHPNADKLNLAKVDVKTEILDIVCGAPNIREGQFVPVALVGVVMPAGFEIKETAIRGEVSKGMLCSPKELGLGEDHSGIMVLDAKKAKTGQDLANYLELDDVIYEIDNKSITNRPDLWGHFGMAREINAFLGVSMVEQIEKKEINFNTKDLKINLLVENKEPELCQRYMAICLDNIKIDDSPQWLQKRLRSVNIRPINNIVDITNCIMADLGQPLHAFDASHVLNNKIIIRKAKDDETIKTLDNVRRKLNSNMLVIADDKKSLAVAGIIGGAESEIKQDTTSIIIECANFDASLIRKASQKLCVRTESSMRFEKGLDPSLCESAIQKTIELIQEICPKATVVSKLIDIQNFSKEEEIIDLDLDWINKRLGVNIANNKVIAILEILGFIVKKPELNKIKVIVPSWRSNDISIREDLLEEIARIYGYNNILVEMPKVKIKPLIINEELELENNIKNILSNAPGLSEAMNYSFVGEDQLKKLQINSQDHISLLNPLASHQAKLRQSLMPNLINNIRTNQSSYDEIGFFEIGNVYKNIEGDIYKDNKNREYLPLQEKNIAIILSNKDSKSDIFRNLKGIVEYLLDSLNISELKWLEMQEVLPWSDSKICAQLEQDLGFVVKIDTKISQKNGIKTNVVVAELKLNKILLLIKKAGPKKYKEQCKYPQLTRDLAFVVAQEILYNNIRDEIINFHELVKDIELFDVYQGESLGDNKKSLAFHIIYQANRTLTNEEVDKIQNKLIENLSNKFSAKIRDF